MAVESIRGNLSSAGRLSGSLAVGGGSDVVITPTYNTGIKIADYSIDGAEGEIYIPTPPQGYTETVLWEGSGYTDSIWNLSQSYKNFDAIEIYVRGGTGDNYITSRIISKSILETMQSSQSLRYGITTDSWYTYFYVRSNTQFERADTSQIYVNKIIGIKY